MYVYRDIGGRALQGASAEAVERRREQAVEGLFICLGLGQHLIPF